MPRRAAAPPSRAADANFCIDDVDTLLIPLTSEPTAERASASCEQLLLGRASSSFVGDFGSAASVATRLAAASSAFACRAARRASAASSSAINAASASAASADAIIAATAAAVRGESSRSK